MQETGLIVDRCKEILAEIKTREVSAKDKGLIKLELQTMSTIINARKTDLATEIFEEQIKPKQKLIGE